MATLILSTAGTAVFGPAGGAIGALIGQQFDQRIFKPGDREGPRLAEINVQTSSYGSQIPKIFGTMRVAGTVVWATDLREDRTREGGGKGRPGTTAYSYSVSFAVALSARPILAVRRIWADGKLLRGGGGDFKSETGFRLHPGGETQAIDPLIAAAEGAGGAPAYRGLALAVFEDFQLADYGNRIPSLSFEVEADTGSVPLARIIGELSEGEAIADSSAALTGYSAQDESVRGAIETLLAALPHQLSDDGAALILSEGPADPLAIDGDLHGAKPGEQGGARVAFERRSAGSVPDEIELRYYEPLRDYQAGLQRARHGGPGRRSERIDLPATLAAPRAKAIAEARLERRWAERVSARLLLPWRQMALRPGSAVRIAGEAGAWRIAGVTLERMAVALDLVRTGGGIAGATDSADPGRAAPDPDLVHGPTTLHLLDLPALDDMLDAAPRLLIAAAGQSPGWRHAALALSLDGGASFESIGRTAPPAIIGEAIDAPAPGQAAMFDSAAAVEIALLHDDMWIEGRSNDALAAGANLALLGDEIIQFGIAEPLGGGRFRLSQLLRGRRGSEWAAANHQPGERFVLLDRASLKRYDAPVAAIGAAVELLATGIGDEQPAAAAMVLAGRSIRPPAPVHLDAARQADGGIAIAWVRRSRIGWAWRDGGDAPLGEEQERWSLTITPDSGAARTAETGAGYYLYSQADQIADGASAASRFEIRVAQLGALAIGEPPAAASFIL